MAEALGNKISKKKHSTKKKYLAVTGERVNKLKRDFSCFCVSNNTFSERRSAISIQSKGNFIFVLGKM